MSFILSGVYSLLNNFRSRFWPKEDLGLKRRRDSLEDEDDDSVFGCDTLSKRPKWMTSAFSSQHMAASGSNGSSKSHRTSILRDSPSIISARKSVSRGRNGASSSAQSTSEVKENDIVEIVDLDDEDEEQTRVEARAPLSSIKVESRNKQHLGAISRNHHHRNHSHERRENGLHSDLFHSFTNGSLRMSSKASTFPKTTAVNESFQMGDRQTYSMLLESFSKGLGQTKTSSEDLSTADWPLLSSIDRFGSKSSRVKATSECIDLTKEDKVRKKSRGNVKQCHALHVACDHDSVSTMGAHHNPGSCLRNTNAALDLVQEVKKQTRINMKPSSSFTQQQDNDDEVQILGVLPRGVTVDRVNSLEKQLALNAHVSPQWIVDMQKKYNERERELQRQVEETRIKKQLFSQHNQKKMNEVLEERIRKHLSLTDVILDDTQDETPLPELTQQMVERIESALRPQPAHQVLVEGFGQAIKRMDIQTLNKLNWLNDEVINFYMCLIIERGKKEKYFPVYAFNTFFYPKLVSQGYNSLRRWTKKVDIFSHDLLLVPVHLGMHWCMATIDFRDKSIRYYDSMGSHNDKCLNALLQYLSEESLDKKKTPYDTSSWKLINEKNIPQQMNGSDCGMFSCMFAEYLSRGAKISFTQANMPYFRRKMVYEILAKNLLL